MQNDADPYVNTCVKQCEKRKQTPLCVVGSVQVLKKRLVKSKSPPVESPFRDNHSVQGATHKQCNVPVPTYIEMEIDV
jgi:hypothetical protein